MYMLNMHLSGRAPRLASQLFMAICAEVDKTVRPKHATLVRDKKTTEFYRLWCESGLAASRHGALLVHVLSTAAVSVHARTWHVFTDGGGATATSEGAAGVGIAIVCPRCRCRDN